jgi:selenide,water dikinase
VSCEASAVDAVLALFASHGFDGAAVVGRVVAAGPKPLQVQG